MDDRSKPQKTNPQIKRGDPAPAEIAAAPAAPGVGLEILGLVCVLLSAAWLRVWHVDRNGFGNTYYAAAVRSMLQSRHNFFFVSFDPMGWVTVDKPPVALWIQAASAKAFGFSSLSVLLPQAAEGVLGVALLYAMVRRAFDRGAALMAALALAAMPVSVAVDRYNNVDACLILVLLLAAFSMSRAVESGRPAWLLAAAALMGVGFNTKMLAAFTILPALFALYALGAPGAWTRRLRDLALAAAVLAALSLAWVGAVDLTPPSERPYVGSTQDNSMLGLTLGWNGLQRFTGRRGGVEAADASPSASAALSSAELPRAGGTRHGVAKALAARQAPAAKAGGAGAFPGRRRGGGRGGMGAGAPGPTRLAQAAMAGQVLWFLPLALLGLSAALRLGAGAGVHRTDADPPGRCALAARFVRAVRGLRGGMEGRPDRQALFLWAGWLILCALVLSALRTMHTYYLVLLAPPMAALSGIGLRALWLDYRQGPTGLLPLALGLTALWQSATLLQTPDWDGALMPLLVGGSALAALILGAAAPLGRRFPGPSWPRIGLATGLLALLACPTGWALTAVLSPTGDRAVQADPTLITGNPDPSLGGAWVGRGQGDGNDNHNQKLLAFLREHRGGARYLVAASNSQAVAPLIIASGEAAIAVGGFMGGDPIVSVAQFAQKVRSGEIRYFLLSAPRRGGQAKPAGEASEGGWSPPWGRGPGGGSGQVLEQWVRQHGRAVDPALWRAPLSAPLYRGPGGAGGFFGGRGGALQLYDLASAPAEGIGGFARAKRRHRSRV